MSAAWNFTEPPKDRTIILCGGVFVKDEFGCFKDSVLIAAHYDHERKMWLDDDGMSIRRYASGELQCYAWSDFPEYPTDSKPITLEAPEPDRVAADTSEEAEPMDRRGVVGEESLQPVGGA